MNSSKLYSYSSFGRSATNYYVENGAGDQALARRTTMILSRRNRRLSFRSFRYYGRSTNNIKGSKTHRTHKEEAKSRGRTTESRAKDPMAIRA
jgi:hypothetical protein